MSKNYNEISEIEAYLRGRMSGAERRAFDEQMATDEAMQSEVAAFRQIFTGLDGLREASFSEDVGQWVAEAKAKSEDNIKPIHTGAKVRQLSPSSWRTGRRLAVAASIALLLGFGAAWWGGGQYSDAAIVERGYVPPLGSATLGDGPELEEVEKQFEDAHELFQNEKHAEAAQAFASFRSTLENNPSLFDGLTRKFYLENTEWTGLLARFAAGEISESEMKNELEKIAADPASEYAGKAKEMLEDLGSFWRVF